MPHFAWTCPTLIVAAGLWVAPLAAADPPPADPPPPVTLTPAGDRLIISGDDPAAVARAYQLARLLLDSEGETYRVFQLEYADADEVGRVLDEWFNGPRPAAVNPLLAALARRGRRGRDNQPPPPPPDPPRIRIVPASESNSLLVRGNVLDLMAVQRVLESTIDVPPRDAAATEKPFVVGPLKAAVATEVVRVIQDVYQQHLDQSTLPGARRGRRGRRPAQPLDATGRPKEVTLSIAADERTNTVVGMAPGPLADDIRKLIGVIDREARDDTQAVQLVPTSGLDPAVFQDVLEAIQATPPAAGSSERRGSNLPGRRGSSRPTRR